MKLFKHQTGFIFAFGWDMVERKENSHRIGWCDPSGSWETRADNLSGFIDVDFDVAPEFIFDLGPQRLAAYQPGRCIELTFAGRPFAWCMTILKPNQDH